MKRQKQTDPILIGFLIGCLSLLSLTLFHHTIGTTTTFVRAAALFWQLFDPTHLAENNYYKSYLDNSSWINWQAAFVFGIFIGAYLASKMSKSAPAYTVAEPWQTTFGSNTLKRSLGAFMGGIIILFGARLAGGCTSGHVLSGGMQLALSGWLFMMAFFATGVATAKLVYRR